MQKLSASRTIKPDSLGFVLSLLPLISCISHPLRPIDPKPSQSVSCHLEGRRVRFGSYQSPVFLPSSEQVSVVLCLNDRSAVFTTSHLYLVDRSNPFLDPTSVRTFNLRTSSISDLSVALNSRVDLAFLIRSQRRVQIIFSDPSASDHAYQVPSNVIDLSAAQIFWSSSSFSPFHNFRTLILGPASLDDGTRGFVLFSLTPNRNPRFIEFDFPVSTNLSFYWSTDTLFFRTGSRAYRFSDTGDQVGLLE